MRPLSVLFVDFSADRRKKIAAQFGGSKTDVQCLHRWQKVLDPKLVKGSEIHRHAQTKQHCGRP